MAIHKTENVCIKMYLIRLWVLSVRKRGEMVAGLRTCVLEPFFAYFKWYYYVINCRKAKLFIIIETGNWRREMGDTAGKTDRIRLNIKKLKCQITNFSNNQMSFRKFSEFCYILQREFWKLKMNQTKRNQYYIYIHLADHKGFLRMIVGNWMRY